MSAYDVQGVGGVDTVCDKVLAHFDETFLIVGNWRAWFVG
jgi:hypothetical protein